MSPSSGAAPAQALLNRPSGGRIESIDAIRALAAFGVIGIHTMTRSNPRLDLGSFCNLGDILNQLCRFAVPFFFTAAGYFFARGLKRSSPWALLGRYLWRLGLLYAVWSIIYTFVPAPEDIPRLGLWHALTARIHANMALARDAWLTLFMEGTAPHLWFFPALMIALGIAGVLAGLKMQRLLLPLGILLYIAGLAGGSYEHTPLGKLFPWQFNTRDGPFYGTLFVAAGFLLAQRAPLGARLGWIMAIGGLALHMAEVLALRWWLGRPVQQNEFVIGSAPWGIGLMIIALAVGSAWRPVRLAWVGRISLGIYVMHWLVRPAALAVVSRIHWQLIWIVLLPTLLFAMTTAAVWLVLKIPLVRRLVS